MDQTMVTHPEQIKKIINDIDQLVLTECESDRSIADVSLLIHVIKEVLKNKRIKRNNWNVHVDLDLVFVPANIRYNQNNTRKIVSKIKKYLDKDFGIVVDLNHKKHDLIFKITPPSL